MQTNIKDQKITTLISSFLLRFAIFTPGWFVLAGGVNLGDIWFVVLCITTTTVISIYTIPPRQWLIRPLAVARFFPYFVIAAIRGGWDVARRVFFRNVPTAPDFITINHTKDPRKTLILVWVISLLPGTASSLITEDNIVVHVLDKNLPVKEEIMELKSRINDMFV